MNVKARELVTIFVACAVVGVSGLRSPIPVTEAGASPGQDRTIVLTDAQGRVRVKIGELSSGEFGIEIREQDGEIVRSRMFVDDAQSSAAFELRDSRGRTMAGGVAAAEGRSAVYVRDPDGQLGRGAMEVDSKRGLWVGLWSQDAQRLVAFEREGDRWGMVLRDAQKAVVALVRSSVRYGMWLLGHDGEESASITSDETGKVSASGLGIR